MRRMRDNPQTMIESLEFEKKVLFMFAYLQISLQIFIFIVFDKIKMFFAVGHIFYLSSPCSLCQPPAVTKRIQKV